MANFLASIFSGLGRGALDRRRELRQRSEALSMEEEGYQRRRNRALMEDDENYARTQARKIQEAERLKSLALQDALETELASKALLGGTADATNIFMQNIPGAPTLADIGMVGQNKALAQSNIKEQTEMARRDYWKNKALKAASGKAKTAPATGSKESKAIISNLKDQVNVQKRIVENLANLKDDPDAIAQDPRIEQRYTYELNKLQKLDSDLMSALEGGSVGGGKEAALKAVKELFDEFTPKKK